jgi:peptidoglycan hydrolase CwlO-like protein
MDLFLRYILPALIGATSAILSAVLIFRVQNHKIVEDDDASLRDALMGERKQLTKEIGDLQKRCDALEDENREQADQMTALKTQNGQLVQEIKHFGQDLPETGP